VAGQCGSEAGRLRISFWVLQPWKVSVLLGIYQRIAPGSGGEYRAVNEVTAQQAHESPVREVPLPTPLTRNEVGDGRLPRFVDAVDRPALFF
jgi:hypothetical protein